MKNKRISAFICYIGEICKNLFMYIPMIVIPMFYHKNLKEIYEIGIMISFWRFVTYYTNLIPASVISSRSGKFVIGTISLRLLLGNNVWDTSVLIIVFTFLSERYEFTNINHEKLDKTSIFLRISGMVVCSILANALQILNILLFGNIIILLLWGKTKITKSSNISFRVKGENDIWDIIFFLQNFHYYCYVIVVPIIVLEIYQLELLVGIVFAMNWSLFMMKNRIYKTYADRINTRQLISIGFFLTACSLIAIGVVKNGVLKIMILILQGGVAGLTELCFKQIDNEDSERYFDSWKLGGILGALSGSVILLLSSKPQVFVFSGIVLLIGVLILEFKI